MLRRLTLTALTAALCAALLGAVPASADAARRGDRIAPGRYIVEYKRSVTDVGAETRARERRHGFRSALRFRHALEGFSARLSDAQVRRLKADPEVASVTADRVVHALGQTVPAGITRIRAAASGVGGVNVAVIDTGIDLQHPDLGAPVDAKNCVGGTSADDDEGHGTHVAGTVAAQDNDADVIGVVPSTKLHAVKVLDSTGSGTWSQIICGIDWAAGTRVDADPSNDIAIANMSLGGGGTSADNNACTGSTTDLHKAVCAATAKGVRLVVAAGNDGWDFDYAWAPDVPAVYPEVLTVAASGDTDGQPGAFGAAPSCRTGEADDRYASFSNYAATSAGRAHTLAAPGVCVLSTRNGGGTEALSGTSMASPHVAGTLAACISAGRCTPSDTVGSLIGKVTSTDACYGYTGDPNNLPRSGRYTGYLALAGTLSTARDFCVGASPASRSVRRGYSTSYTVTRGASNGFSDPVTLSVTGRPAGTSVSWTNNPAAPPTSSTLTVRTSSSTPKGTYRLTITGTSGGLVHSRVVTLTVTG